MTEPAVDSPVIVLAVGLIVVASLFIKGCLDRTGVFSLVGFPLVSVATATCTLAPLTVRALLVKWPQTEHDDER